MMQGIANGAATLLRSDLDRGLVDAVIAIGGGTGSWLARHILTQLPLGVPKVLLTTVPGQRPRGDIVEIPTIVDVAGLNQMLLEVLDRGAAVVCQLATVEAPTAPSSHGKVAQSMFGVTTSGGNIARRSLEEGGFEVAVFHSNGQGGRDMNELLRQRRFDLLFDWTLSEITDELLGGVCTAGPDRLSAGHDLGLPKVLVPGAIEVINLPLSRVSEFEEQGRCIHWHTPDTPLARTNVQEMAILADFLSSQINGSAGLTRVVIPSQGFSELSRAGAPFDDAEADAEFIAALVSQLDVQADVVDANINDAAFAVRAAEALFAVAR
jgi:uncharacterized protein (UPF0261 family)